MVVEEINAIMDTMELVVKYDVELLIVTVVDAIINCGADPKNAVKELMGRDSKTEFPKHVLDLNFEAAVIKISRLGYKETKT